MPVKTLTLSLTTSCGNIVKVPYHLPDSVVFDCFVPGWGVAQCEVDVSAEEVCVVELHERLDEYTTRLLPDGFMNDEAVIEQAGDVCSFFDDAGFMGSAPSKGCRSEQDGKTFTTIADLARHEQALRYAWGCVPPALRTGNYVPEMLVTQHLAGSEAPNMDARAVRVLHAFIHTVVVERAQGAATKAAQKRQREWEAQQAEHLREARCDARQEVTP